MRGITAAALAIAIAGVLAPPLSAQTTADTLRAEVLRLRARIDSLEQVVARLQREGRDAEPERDELAALRAAARAAAGEARPPDTTQTGGSRTRSLQSLNPEISVTGDIVSSLAAPSGEAAELSSTPREFEFSFQAALDPYTHTKVFVTREEPFPVAGLSEDDAAHDDGHGGFHIEEGYVYWVGLPGGFGAKMGKFRQEIGLSNRWHTHALLEVDRPLAATTFLAEDGLIQTGAQVTLPSATAGPLTATAVLAVTRGDNEALFRGGHDLSYLGRLQHFLDLGPAAYLQLGATGVTGGNDDALLTSRLLGLDVAFRYAPPAQAAHRDVQVRGEWYVARQDLAGVVTTAHGGYGQLNARVGQRWLVGTRVDYVDAASLGGPVTQIVPGVTWWQSEWVRLRLQYHYVRPAGGPTHHTVLLQAVWAMGPHRHESY